MPKAKSKPVKKSQSKLTAFFNKKSKLLVVVAFLVVFGAIGVYQIQLSKCKNNASAHGSASQCKGDVQGILNNLGVTNTPELGIALSHNKVSAYSVCNPIGTRPYTYFIKQLNKE